MTNIPDLKHHLDDAIAALLRARLQLGPLDAVQPPTLALDEAVGRDPPYQVAQTHFRDALSSNNALDIEAAHHEAVARTVEVGWSVATTTFSNTIKEHNNV